MDKAFGKITAAEVDLLASFVSTTDETHGGERTPRTSSALGIARLSAPSRPSISRLSMGTRRPSGALADVAPRSPRSPRRLWSNFSMPRWSAMSSITHQTSVAASTGIDEMMSRALPGQNEEDYMPTKAVLLGLYCTQMLIGLVNGVLLQNLVKPFCLYVFQGMQNKEVTFSQCNIAPIVYQLPWNFKVLIALFLDTQPLFGSRRYAWILFGWGAALACLLGASLRIESWVATQNFGTYNSLLMCMCFFYMFAEVSADGLTIELSQYEGDAERGRLLTVAQMVRGCSTAIAVLACAFLLNGPAMYLELRPGPESSIFSFGLNMQQVHWMVFGIGAALYIVMACCLRDPPDRGYSYDWREVVYAFWETTQSKAMLYMILFNVGFVGIAGLGNPIATAVASIVMPTPWQLCVSSFLSKMLFLIGVTVFRRFFMARNWRVTCVCTHMFFLVEGLFYLAIIYDIDGFGQTGYFYCFGDCPLYMILGMSQVLSLLAAVEISKCGLEATTYELLTTVHNVALALNSNIGNTLIAAMNINSLNHNSYEAARHHDGESHFNKILRNATIVTMGIQLCGTLGFVWLLPQDGIMCRLWRDDAGYHTKRVGALGLIVASFTFSITVVLSLFALIPETRCLRIVGGLGCNF